MSNIHFVDRASRNVAFSVLGYCGAVVLISVGVGRTYLWESIPDKVDLAATSEVQSDRSSPSYRIPQVTHSVPLELENEIQESVEPEIPNQEIAETASEHRLPQKVLSPTSSAEANDGSRSLTDFGPLEGEIASKYELDGMDSYYRMVTGSGAIFAAVDTKANLSWRLGKSLREFRDVRQMTGGEHSTFSRRMVPLPKRDPDAMNASNSLAIHGLGHCEIVLLVPNEVDQAILNAQKQYLAQQGLSSSDSIVTKVRVNPARFGELSIVVAGVYRTAAREQLSRSTDDR